MSYQYPPQFYPPPESSGGGSGAIIVVFVILVLLVGLGIGGWYFYTTSNTETKEIAPIVPIVPIAPIAPIEPEPVKVEIAPVEDILPTIAPPPPGPTYVFPPFAMNTTTTSISTSSNNFLNGTYVATSSSNFVGTTGASAFQNSPGNTSNGWMSSNPTYSTSKPYAYKESKFMSVVDRITYAGEWVQLQVPSLIDCVSFTLFPQGSSSFFNRTPSTFVLAGSKDGNIWECIHNQQIPVYWLDNKPQTFICSENNKSLYRRFRFIILSVSNGSDNFGSYASIGFLKLFTSTASVLLPEGVLAVGSFVIGQSFNCNKGDPDNNNTGGPNDGGQITYRYAGGKSANPYSTTTVASSWDVNWNNPQTIDCTGLTFGLPLAEKPPPK